MADEDKDLVNVTKDEVDEDVDGGAFADIHALLGDGRRGSRITLPWVLRTGKMVHVTPLQHRFITEFLKDHNASGAARRAGYKHYLGINNNPFYKPVVREILYDELQYQFAAHRLTSERLLAEMQSVAMASPEQLAIYARMGIKVSLRDKNQAIETLMKHLNMFAEDNKREVSISITDLIKESYAIKPRTAKAITGATPVALPVVKDGDEVVPFPIPMEAGDE